MTQRIIGPTGSRRRRRVGLLLPLIVLVPLVVAIAAAAGPVGVAAGFEDDDGNLVVDSTFDWNGFAPTTWTGVAPFRTSEKVASGWKFLGLEDHQASTADTGFAGGTKQDDNCASVVGSKAPNKDDVKRAYVSSKNVGGKTYLMLAWVRIPQNTTSASAHVAFEFNKGSSGACAGTSGLVNRTAGDMLIVYDFAGGTAAPILTLRRWVTSGTCEISSNSAPCWGPATNLSALGFAEARVNVGGSVSDAIGPAGSETLADSEFGEAGIDLTGANVFPASSCESFGNVFAVSRSSGNSGTAQMKDLVGPGNFTLSNCGTIVIKKRTSPRGLNQSFNFTSTIAGAQLDCTADTTPAAFVLNDNGNSGTNDSAGNTETCLNVPAGTYTVTEGADPTGFGFNNFSCTASGDGTSASPTSSTTQKNVSITIAGGGSVTCVYTNDRLLGAIRILKKSTKTGTPLVANAGAVFSYGTGLSVTDNGTGDEDSTIGEVCVSGLALGNYTVNETSPPSGYGGASQSDLVVVAAANTDCGSNQPSGTGEITFTNPPLADIQVRFRDGGSGETSLVSPISCTNTTTGTSSTEDTTGWDDSLTVTGLDAPVTLVCTIDIDP